MTPIVWIALGLLALRKYSAAQMDVVGDAEIAPGIHRRTYRNGCVRFWKVSGSAIQELPARPEWLAAAPGARSCFNDALLLNPSFGGPVHSPGEDGRRLVSKRTVRRTREGQTAEFCERTYSDGTTDSIRGAC